MKDISIIEKYKIYCCAGRNGSWEPTTGTYDSVQAARRSIAKYKQLDRRDRIKFDYQVVKITIKEEIIK